MGTNSTITPKWSRSAGKAFWGVVLTSFAGIISTVYDYVAFIVGFIEYASKTISNMLKDFGGGDSIPSIAIGELLGIGFSSKALIVIGYILYLWGLTSFAKIQRIETTAMNVRKVRSATILLIVTFLLDIVFGVLSIIPFASIFFGIITWIMFMVCFYKMKHAFADLMTAQDFSPRAQRGARNLRYAACCEIRLKWLPIVTGLIVLFIILTAVMVLTSKQSLEGMEGLFKAVTGAIVLVLIVAGIMTLFAMFCAFWWPIIGWYRIKTGGAALNTDASTQDALEGGMAVEAISAPDVQAETETMQQEAESFSDTNNWVDTITTDKKNLYICGGILATVLIALGLWFAFSTSSETNPFGIEKPSWEKFIVVTTQDVPLQKEARSDSPKLMEALENIGSDMATREFRWEDEGKKRGYTIYPYNLSSNTVLPVIEETDTWYKVQVHNEMNLTVVNAFIKKEWCREIKPEPITEEVLTRVGKTMRRKDYIVEKGELKNLCLTTLFSDMDGESFQVGAFVDGVLIYPKCKKIYPRREDVSEINLQKNEEYDCYMLTYGEGQQSNLDEYFQVLDPGKLTDEMVKQIYETVKEPNQSQLMEVEYYFPEANQDFFFKFVYTAGNQQVDNASAQNVSEPTKVTGYHEEERGGESILMAEFGSASEETGVDYIGPLVEVTDLDGDGNMDAFVQDGVPGSSGNYSYSVVCYDESSDKFIITDNISTMSDSPEIVEWNNRKCILVADGIRIDRYALEASKLQNISTEKGDVGATLVKIPIDRVFSETVHNGEPEEREVTADINGDGINETLVFSHGDARAYALGDYMILERVRWADGSFTDSFESLYAGDTFAFLQNQSNGLPDILVRDLYLFRWNGSAYEQWNWDGTEFKKATENY